MIDYSKVARELKTKFIYMDSVIEELCNCHAAGEHLILYGPGGHAKSEVAQEFFKLVGQKSHLVQFGSGTRRSDIVGDLDLQKWFTDHEVAYKVHEAFMGSAAAIFEEFFDAPPQLLQMLKSILTEKQYCFSTACYPLKTQMIVACTNYTPHAWANASPDEVDSRKALVQRFAKHVEVKWPDYSAASYASLFKLRTGSPLTELAMAMQISTANRHFISPRTAMKAVKFFKIGGLKALRNLDSMPDVVYNLINRTAFLAAQDAAAAHKLAQLSKSVQAIASVRVLKSAAEGLSYIAILEELKRILTGIRINDTNGATWRSYSHTAVTINSAKSVMQQLIANLAFPTADMIDKYLTFTEFGDAE